MNIKVGSTNVTKIQAVKDMVLLYPNIFPNSQVESLDIKVETYGHPKSLQETIQGAVERAKKAFVNCDYSFGLESGLMQAPGSNGGYLEIPVAAVFDGNNMYIGCGPAFEWPKKVLEVVLKGEADASKAFKDLGLTKHEKLGAMHGGIINFLTNGRLTREEQTKQSIIMALIQLEQKEMYT